MKAIRLIQDSEAVDLEVVGGSLAVGDVLEQNQYLLLVTHQGEWKEHPTLGVGIGDMVNDEDLTAWKQAISQALEADGQMIERLELTGKKLTIEARYR